MSEPNIEYVINGDEVLVINHSQLDPNGQPIMAVITIEEYEKIKNK